MLITNDETGKAVDVPLCRNGCGGFEEAPNPLCHGHGGVDAGDLMRRICEAIGHINGARTCLRCREVL